VKRTFIIGDVHGCAVELDLLLAKLSPQEGDSVIFVGDLVDKGPESARVVRTVSELSKSDTFDVVLVEGNHEEKHKRFRKNLVLQPDVAERMVKRSPHLAEITDELSDEDIAFLETAVFFHRVPEHGVLVIHGGIPDDVIKFPSEEEAAAAGGKLKRMLTKTQRTRFLTSDTGKFVVLGEENEGDPFWAETHDGRFGHVVFGHEPFLDGPKVFPHATSIDTGVVKGGSLTALVIEPTGERSFVSVPACK
jgi:serine/threonine protein phosphatase 1